MKEPGADKEDLIGTGFLRCRKIAAKDLPPVRSPAGTFSDPHGDTS